MDYYWLGPDDSPPRLRFTGTSAASIKGQVSPWEQQRRAAIRAACEMTVRSRFDAPEPEEAESGEGESDEDEFASPYSSQHNLLTNAVARFNYKCYEEDARFQWFGVTISGPLQLAEVRGTHRKGCEVCGACPELGEPYFKYNLGVDGAPWTCDKLCMTCGTGILYAALQEMDADSDSLDDPDDGPGPEEPDSGDLDSESAGSEQAGEDSPESPAGREQQQDSARQPAAPSPPAAASGRRRRAGTAADLAAGRPRRGVAAEAGAEHPMRKRQRHNEG